MFKYSESFSIVGATVRNNNGRTFTVIAFQICENSPTKFLLADNSGKLSVEEHYNLTIVSG